MTESRQSPRQPPERPKVRLSRLFWVGVILLILGSGPLICVIILASLGLTKDPNPNPVGFGILAFLTFWPSLILTIVGAVQSWRRYNSTRTLPLRHEGTPQ